MTQKDRMLAGKPYRVDETLAAHMRRTRERLHQFNLSLDAAQRQTFLRVLLGGMGENSYIEPPFRCDYGANLYVGKNFYANFECIVLDQCPIRIGDNVFFGPRVSLYSAGHPIDAEIRNTGLEFGKPITIGSDVWVGGDTVILGGVTIGSNVVIGAGSVVTKDIPSGVIAAGNPCRILREITEADRETWEARHLEYQVSREQDH